MYRIFVVEGFDIEGVNDVSIGFGFITTSLSDSSEFFCLYVGRARQTFMFNNNMYVPKLNKVVHHHHNPYYHSKFSLILI